MWKQRDYCHSTIVTVRWSTPHKYINWNSPPGQTLCPSGPLLGNFPPLPAFSSRQLNPPDILDNHSPGEQEPVCTGAYCIPHDYNKIEPPFSPNNPLHVKINIDKVRILEFNDKKFTMSLSMFLAVQWTETRLKGPPPSPTQPFRVMLRMRFKMLGCLK